MRLTPEKAVGIKFELWLRNYFRSIGFDDVAFNVEFHKSRYLYRQVDLVVAGTISPLRDRRPTDNPRPVQYLVEAKYSSNGPIRYGFRQGYKVKAESHVLTNIIDELLERQEFVKSCGSYRSMLVTNRYFDDRILSEASRYGIHLVEGAKLFQDYLKLGGIYSSLERSIGAVDLKRFDLRPRTVWMKR